MRRDALEYLRFWLKSVDTHAVHRHDKGAAQQRRRRERNFAPVVLVGTHYDAIKEDADVARKLGEINVLLVQEFGGIESLQTSLDEKWTL